MLHNFLNANRQELVERCRGKVAARPTPRPTAAELEHGIPLFLQQLTNMLEAQERSSPPYMLSTATRHGEELLQSGFTLAQVIHDYGDLCQAITELADETKATINARDFGSLNRCLDDAIAAAVTAYTSHRERRLEADGVIGANARLAFLAHELRNLLNTAMLSFEVIKAGNVAINGTTSALHDRSLRGLRSLVDRSLTEARLAVGIHKEHIPLLKFIQEVELAAALEADASSVRLTVSSVDPSLAVSADRAILAAVFANLLQNAFKFTRENGHADVSFRVRQVAERVFFDVEDECGGLRGAVTEQGFLAHEQHNIDRSGLGLGLTICRRGVESNDGLLHVRNLPGKGCVFSVELAAEPALANDLAR